MTQNSKVVLDEITYTRADYTALRAYVLRIPLQRIADLYYGEDSPQVEMGLERFLISMRDKLVERAIEHNPQFAAVLANARQGGALTSKALEILIQAADLPKPAPGPEQLLGQWFRPRTVRALREEGVQTLGQLVDLLNRRGPGWWRSIPRIGAGRAAAIASWLRSHSVQLGELGTEERPVACANTTLVVDPRDQVAVMPLGTFVLPSDLDGSAGLNRANGFCFISARTDLEAVECYLARYQGQTHTLRAYRKELERFILWSAWIARKPMSSLLVTDCEEYKAFLKSPHSSFTGPRAPRNSRRWRPFTEESMSAASQKQAILILRAAFDYLVKVRYLGGNPWVAVKDPVVVQEVNAIKVERSLSLDCWGAVVDALRQRGQDAANLQDRIALAAILLMGDSGLRRAELSAASRKTLIPSRHAKGVWMMTVLGKRSKKRLVAVSPRTIDALRIHWQDRGLDFDNAATDTDLPLVAPIVIPRTPAALARHEENEGSAAGYTGNGIFALVESALRRIQPELAALTTGDDGSLAIEDFHRLLDASPHAFRHTFGTLAVEKGMPLDVVQAALGHESASTTAIYVGAAEKRLAAEASRIFATGSDE